MVAHGTIPADVAARWPIQAHHTIDFGAAWHRTFAEIAAPRDGRLMMLLLDELRQEPALPLHLPQPTEPRLARICRAIVRHPERQDGAADWARALGVDPKTVHRLFLRHTGMTFGRWRQQARLLAAMERLARGERVLEVALDLGYESPSAFAAMFRKAVGEPPSAFAARGMASA